MELTEKLADLVTNAQDKPLTEYDIFQNFPGDHRDETGLMVCGGCGTYKEIRLQGEVLSCMCKCASERYQMVEQARKRREMQDVIDRNRKAAFACSALRSASFANDDGKSAELMRLCRNYAKRFTAQSDWLLLYGDVGVGKSYAAAAIVNAVLDNGCTALFTTLPQFERTVWNAQDKQAPYNRICRCDLLVLDDLGADRRSEYMNEILFNLIDERLQAGKPMIITSNLNADQLLHPENLEMRRILSRVYERTVPYCCKGTDRRRASMNTRAKQALRSLLEA